MVWLPVIDTGPGGVNSAPLLLLIQRIRLISCKSACKRPLPPSKVYRTFIISPPHNATQNIMTPPNFMFSQHNGILDSGFLNIHFKVSFTTISYATTQIGHCGIGFATSYTWIRGLPLQFCKLYQIVELSA